MILFYTIISAWLCLGQFNYTVSAHHYGPPLVITTSSVERHQMDNGCILIDYVWLEEEKEK